MPRWYGLSEEPYAGDGRTSASNLDIAQLVEQQLSKLSVAGSTPAIRRVTTAIPSEPGFASAAFLSWASAFPENDGSGSKALRLS